MGSMINLKRDSSGVSFILTFFDFALFSSRAQGFGRDNHINNKFDSELVAKGVSIARGIGRGNTNDMNTVLSAHPALLPLITIVVSHIHNVYFNLQFPTHACIYNIWFFIKVLLMSIIGKEIKKILFTCNSSINFSFLSGNYGLMNCHCQKIHNLRF